MTQQAPSRDTPFQHHGSSREMIALSFKNLLLNIVTLSMWRFWGKTRVRRQLWEQTTIWGDPLDYTGTGGELFRGFLIVIFLIFLPASAAIVGLQYMLESGHPIAALGILAVQLGFAVLAGIGLYRAYRYQLTRTRWRGIRANVEGSALTYAFILLGTGIAIAFSLGWAAPWAQMELARYRLHNTRFGTGRFRCNATAKGLYRRFAVCWFATILTLAPIIGVGVVVSQEVPQGDENQILAGIVFTGIAAILYLLINGLTFAWYKAAFYRQLAASTQFEGLSFAFDVRAWPLARLWLGNIAISVLSLGILAPWAALRLFRFSCTHLEVDGMPDWTRVAQDNSITPRMGEGLASVFDSAGAF